MIIVNNNIDNYIGAYITIVRHRVIILSITLHS